MVVFRFVIWCKIIIRYYLKIAVLIDKEKIEEKELGFSVDAGIINRLGLELVGRSETAVSELIKNSYDADATVVKVYFRDTNIKGGSLVMEDDGEGMNFKRLKNGFMRLSSTDKIHNPVSEKFSRKKAGKKGIGRFSTQRLGSKLTIITKRKEMPLALRIVINWDSYEIDTDLSEIKNEVTYVPWSMNYESGTQITIDHLRESWDNVEIRRVYRYISNLLQPNFLSDRSKSLNLAYKSNRDNSFAVFCYKNKNQEEEEISAPDKILFNKAIAEIEGWVDNDHNGYCSVKSEKFEINDNDIAVGATNKKDEIEKYQTLKNISFKAYYFIYVSDYYDFDNNFTSLELKSVQKIAEESSGVKLYRNGFRVYPYGEKGNDWLSIDRKLAKLRAENGINIPFGNTNLFGFIEIIDNTDEKISFEETASREGLIEDDTFRELQDFVYKTLHIAMLRVASAEKFIESRRDREKKGKRNKRESTLKKIEGFDDIKKSVVELQEKIKQDDPDKDEYITSFLKELPKQIDATKSDFEEHIKENAMLRVLAGIGLVIGEFVHEIEQFDTIFKSKIKFLKKKINDSLIVSKVNDLEEGFLAYQSYTAYFRASVSQNAKREIKPINLKITINSFFRQLESNSNKANITVNKKFLNQFLVTCPMHPSEWLSILFNLYTNSKKAIKRNKEVEQGQILIKISNIDSKIHLEFSDNGDGVPDDIKEKIFQPFYTTSNPVDSEELDIKDNSGTGLGLYIVEKIINSYDGTIKISSPSEKKFNTSFIIVLPSNE